MTIHARVLGLVCLALLGCSEGEAPLDPPDDLPKQCSSIRARGRKNFVGVFDPQTARWRLNLRRPGWNEDAGEREFVFGAPGDLPVIGDWDGDGDDSQGTWRDGQWSLADELGSDIVTQLRFGNVGDLPIVGDWDGDGRTTVGTFRDGVFSLRNSNTEGAEIVSVRLGKAGDVPVAGDWDGDGRETVGVFAPSEGTFTLIDEHKADAAVHVFAMAAPPGAIPVVGDWDDDGVATIGMRVESVWTLRNANAIAMDLGTTYVEYGGARELPIVGSWVCNATLGFANAPVELTNFFILAADYQPVDSFEKWKGRGLNTVIRVIEPEREELRASAIDAWTAEANRLGLKMIREPRANPLDDAAETSLLAYLIRDEPDIAESDPFAELQTLAEGLRAPGLRRRPVFTNFAGWNVLNPDAREPDPEGLGDLGEPDWYSRYVDMQDWVSQDIYPLGQMMSRLKLSEADAMATLPLTMAKLRRWAPDKPQFAYIESSQSDLSAWPPLTPGQFRAQVWMALVQGARGIFYFPHGGCTGPCGPPDVMTPDVVEEMKTQNARVTELTMALQAAVDPASMAVTAARPVHTGWRVHGEDKYVIAVNYGTRAVERSISLAGMPPTTAIDVLWEGRTIQAEHPHAFLDTFGPYAVHVYRFR
jgi:hypothetical protein